MNGEWDGRYAELGVLTNFSFLEGASHPGEIMEQAKALGLTAVGVADRNTLAGIVRALMGAEDNDIRLVVGSRLAFIDGTELIVFPRDRSAYGRLCRLLTLGKSEAAPQAGAPSNVISFSSHSGEGHDPKGSAKPEEGLSPAQRADRPWVSSAAPPSGVPIADGEEKPDRIDKGETRLTFEQAVGLGAGMIALATAPERLDAAFEARLLDWRRRWPDTLYLAAAPLWRGGDRARLNRLAAMAERTGAPLIATNATLYHHPDRRPLQDVLTCVREGMTIDQAGLRLQANAERHLKPPAQMARLFKGHEAALARTMEVTEACTFSLREISYQYPDEPVPKGWTPQRWLIRLTFRGARERWQKGPPAHVIETIKKELRLIRQLDYAAYFLTVHDIVAWARAKPREILCQGRGSAANSVVCFCLMVTNVDPTQQDVLIERFISSERSEPPDIDVDFEHERREEVMQYVYRRYGRHRAGIVATIIHYRPRSAIRDVGKALGLTEDVTARMADTVWGAWGSELKDENVDRAGLDRDDPRLELALRLTSELIGFPRHLSQHVGGFVLSQGPLNEIVPIGNAAMADRTFIEWDKDDIDFLKLMKVDVLALGMLTAMKRAFAMIETTYGRPLPDTAAVPTERRGVYRMLRKADSLGVFQVESRAQMSMLPRLQPNEFYDLVVQVAIVRPGPIQGKMVHPYLQRRAARRAYEADPRNGPGSYRFTLPGSTENPEELTQVLGKTLGVPLFQEQAMRIAMVAAEFSGGEANGLRRAMATFRHMGDIGVYEARMVNRMIARGYSPEFAQNCFNQIKGFGEYGFPESHACAFAHLVYVSAWVKWLYPDVFAACLLNSQPMGFYAPAQIVRDAREHRVEVRHPDVNASDWDATLEPRPKRRRRDLRLGLRSIDGFRKAWAQDLMDARAERPFADLDDLRVRSGLPPQALDRLAEADAFGSLDLSRRQGLWAAKGLAPAASAPLFEAMGLSEADGRPPDALPRLSRAEEVVGDYQTIRLSLKGHPVAFLRPRLDQAGAATAADYQSFANGRRVRVGGVVLVRQRPGTAKGVVFMTIEDETGVANLVLWEDVFERFRPVAMGARMVLATGRLQQAEGVSHLVVEQLDDWTPMLSDLASDAPGSAQAPQRPRHPRDVRVLPGSRDFH